MNNVVKEGIVPERELVLRFLQEKKNMRQNLIAEPAHSETREESSESAGIVPVNLLKPRSLCDEHDSEFCSVESGSKQAGE